MTNSITENRSTFQNLIGTPYSFRELMGWIWRNVTGVRKGNPSGIRPLPQQRVLNPIRPRITLGFIGDIMDMNRKVLSVSNPVRDFMRSCDFLFGNFEATITHARKPGLFAQAHDPSILESLAEFFPPHRTFLSVANNHAGDFPLSVFRESLVTIRKRGFHVLGTLQEPVADIPGPVRVVAASMWSNHPFEEMVTFDALGEYCGPAGFHIAYPHWGYELERFPRPAIVRACGQLLQRFDAVVGHHSHVPQPLADVRYGVGSKLAAFSLGDFCTGLRIKKYQYGIVCRMEIGPGEDGLWRIGLVDWRYTRILPQARETLNVDFAASLRID